MQGFSLQQVGQFILTLQEELILVKYFRDYYFLH